MVSSRPTGLRSPDCYGLVLTDLFPPEGPTDISPGASKSSSDARGISERQRRKGFPPHRPRGGGSRAFALADYVILRVGE